MPVKLTTAYWKIAELQKRIKVIQGSQGSSKTFSILILILQKAIQSQIKATIVTATYPMLKDGAIADMRTICHMANIDFDEHFNKQDKNLNIFGSEIQFRNLDNKDFHKSKGVRRDILYINEANRVGFKSVDQMMTRSKSIFIDYNPDAEFWVHTEILNRDDADFIILVYQQNEELSNEEREEIESRVRRSKEPDAPQSLIEWVRVYAYGELGTYSERRIYSYSTIKEIPETAKRIPSGMDFGKSPDKTSLINLYIDGSKLYADEVFTLNNLLEETIQGSERPSIAQYMESINFPKSQPIIADSAGARSIIDLKKHGFKVFAVKKYQGAQRDGIAKVRGYDLVITERSKNLKHDLDRFLWKEDNNGMIIPEPDGHEPDTLVSIRYAMLMHRN